MGPLGVLGSILPHLIVLAEHSAEMDQTGSAVCSVSFVLCSAILNTSFVKGI